MPCQRLTESWVAQLECVPGRAHREVYDVEVVGLYVDVLRSGRRRYRVRYRDRGRYRVMSLGDASIVTLAEAREQAREVQRCVRRGGDPKASWAPSGRWGLHWEPFFMQHYLPYIRSYKRSWRTDLILYRRHIAPHWQERAMESVTAQEVAGLVRGWRHLGYAPASCNRILSVVRYAYTLARRWELIDMADSPARSVRPLKEDNRMERYLSWAEMHDLLVAARRSRNTQLVDLIAVLLYTGARRSEVLRMRWSEVDVMHRMWRIRRTKSGRVRHVPLSSAALAVLERRCTAVKRDISSSEYVFANPATGKPFTSFFFSFKAACREAGLEGLRIHDLRHSFASFLVNAGHSLYEVQALLGHAHIQTTTRYAHLSQERLFHAVEAVPSEEGVSLGLSANSCNVNG